MHIAKEDQMHLRKAHQAHTAKARQIHITKRCQYGLLMYIKKCIKWILPPIFKTHEKCLKVKNKKYHVLRKSLIEWLINAVGWVPRAQNGLVEETGKNTSFRSISFNFCSTTCITIFATNSRNNLCVLDPSLLQNIVVLIFLHFIISLTSYRFRCASTSRIR